MDQEKNVHKLQEAEGKEPDVKEGEVQLLEVKEAEVQVLELKEAGVQELGNAGYHKETTGGEWTTVNHSRRKPGTAGEALQEDKKVKEVKMATKDYKCKKCSFRTETVLSLEHHMKCHKEEEPEDFCDICQEHFTDNVEYKLHFKKEHSKQWNCDDCDFQSSTRVGLMNHCKVKPGHKPSRGQKSKSTVLECYTCKSEFRSYHNLMEHRKEEHPSHKKCRYFVKGECFFSAEECWYIHEDTTTETNNPQFDCFDCKNRFKTKHELNEHKTKNHKSDVPCRDFQKGECDRSAEKCKFKHLIAIHTSSKSPSQGAWNKPLSNMQEQNFPQIVPRTPPDQGTLMVALNMISQRLETLEKKMFPQHN